MKLKDNVDTEVLEIMHMRGLQTINEKSTSIMKKKKLDRLQMNIISLSMDILKFDDIPESYSL